MIQIDRREQKNQHIEDYFKSHDIPFYGFSLPVGDYAKMNDHHIIIDKKGGLQEVYSNIVQQHDRFMRECRLAQDAGIKLIVLIEEPEIKDISEVFSWVNPRTRDWQNIEAAHSKGKMLTVRNTKKPPMSSLSLQNAMMTISRETGVEWRFTTVEKIAEEILEILGEVAE